MPRPIVDQLAAQIAKLMADPATRDKLTTLSLEPLPPSTPDSFAAYIKTEVDRWAVIVKNSGAEPNDKTSPRRLPAKELQQCPPASARPVTRA